MRILTLIFALTIAAASPAWMSPAWAGRPVNSVTDPVHVGGGTTGKGLPATHGAVAGHVAATGKSPAASTEVPDQAGNAEAFCKEYKDDAKKQARLIKACGIHPEHEAKAPGSTPPSEADAEIRKVYNECLEVHSTKWGMVGPYCDALEVTGTTRKLQLGAAIAYTAASTACFVGCAFAPSAGACAVAGAAAGAIDIGFMIAAAAKATEHATFWQNSGALGLVGTAGGAATAIGAIITTTSAQTIAGVSAACWGGIFFAAVAAAKWTVYGMSGGHEDELKADIMGQAGKFGVYKPGAQPGPDAKGGGGGIAGGGAGLEGGKGMSAGGSGGGGSSGLLEGDVEDLESPMYAAANAGQAGEIFKQVQKSQVKELVAKALNGMTIGDIAKKLQSGSSPGSVLSAVAGLTDSAKAALNGLDQDLRDGKLSLNIKDGASSTYAGGRAGGGGASSGAAPMFASTLGMKGPAASGKEESFEKTKKKLLADPESEDIWHEHYAGSIFQIVSFRVDRARERVDKLEWATPLNRALAGLPKLTTSSNGGKK